MFRPSRFFALVWLILISLDFFINDIFHVFYPIGVDTYIFIAIAAFFVLLGGAFSYNFFPIKPLQAGLSIFEMPIYLLLKDKFWLVILFLITLLTCLEHFMMVGATWILPAGVDQYRYMVTENGDSRLFPLLGFFNFFLFFSGAFLVIHAREMRFYVKVIFIFFLAFSVYLSSSRSFIFVLALITCFTYILLYGFRWWCFLLPFFLAFVFLVVGLITGKTDPFSLIIYTFSPVHAFSELMAGGAQLQSNVDLFSFRFLHPIFSYFGLITNGLTMLDYVQTPLPTNVYTSFFVYWYDFGWWSLVFWFFLGFFSDYFYKWFVVTRCQKSLLVNALILNCMALSVFYDYFTSSAFVYVSLIIILLFYPDPSSKQNTARSLDKVSL